MSVRHLLPAAAVLEETGGPKHVQQEAPSLVLRRFQVVEPFGRGMHVAGVVRARRHQQVSRRAREGIGQDVIAGV